MLREVLSGLGVLPVVELPSVAAALPLAAALVTSGCGAAEITLRTPAGLAALARMRSAQPDLLIGAGTVRTLADVRRAADAGAQFLVSPVLNPDLIDVAVQLGVPIVPGAATPTEIDAARRAGAGIVKFFPAEALGGARAVAAIGGPLPDALLLPTGGITAANLGDYLRLPNVVACAGSWLVAKELLSGQRFDEVAARTAEALAIAARARAVRAQLPDIGSEQRTALAAAETLQPVASAAFRVACPGVRACWSGSHREVRIH